MGVAGGMDRCVRCARYFGYRHRDRVDSPDACPAREAHIMAVDIDEDAVKQAKENVEKSPWPGRIEVERHDICCFNSDIRYDVIVSNPPYFFNSLEMS